MKEIDTAQLAAGATLAPHVFETIEKSLAFEPLSPTAERTRGTLPLLVSVIVCGIDVTPTLRDEYANVMLESEAVGMPPLPVRGMYEEYPVTRSVTIRLSSLSPVANGLKTRVN